MRKYYIDNLRWSAVAVLIAYHAAMAWNTWGEPNYIIFGGNKIISSGIVAFSTFLMPLLFVLAGISTKYSLKKRTAGQYLTERVKKLLIPFVFGTLVFMPIMTYIADRHNCGHTGSFFGHYAVFFTKFTDLTGADGGFSVGQFWFLIYLFAISLIFIVIHKIQDKIRPSAGKIKVTFPIILLLGIPVLPLHEFLPTGGKSLFEYLYLFLIGYYILSDEAAVERLSAHRTILIITSAVSTFLTVYLFLWTDTDIPAVPIINTIARSFSEWFTVLALISLAYGFRNKDSAVTRYMSQRSFMFYSFHYVWIVLFQYLLGEYLSGNTFLLYIIPVVLAYAATLLSCEICIRIPPLCFLMGTKPLRKTNREMTK